MATPYETIYNRALNKLEDPQLLMMPEEDLEEMLHGYLLSAIAKHRKCEHDLSDRDEELKQFNSDLSDLEIEILSILVLREWISQRLHSVTNVLQVFSGKETKWFSQAQHIAELRALDESLKLEAQKLSRDYTYTNNDYFNDFFSFSKIFNIFYFKCFYFHFFITYI